MSKEIQFKTLYTTSGAEEIITNFLNKRFTVTAKDEQGILVSKKKNKRITEVKVNYILHKLWVDKLHKKLPYSIINRNILADDIFGDKRYETSMIIRFLVEDKLIVRVKNAVHYGNKKSKEGLGESAGYTFGELLEDKEWTVKPFPNDCALIRNMIEFNEQFARMLQEEAQEQPVLTPEPNPVDLLKDTDNAVKSHGSAPVEHERHLEVFISENVEVKPEVKRYQFPRDITREVAFEYFQAKQSLFLRSIKREPTGVELMNYLMNSFLGRKDLSETQRDYLKEYGKEFMGITSVKLAA